MYIYKETLRPTIAADRVRSLQRFSLTGTDAETTREKTVYLFQQESARAFLSGFTDAETQVLVGDGHGRRSDTGESLLPTTMGNRMRREWVFGESGYPENFGQLRRQFAGQDKPPRPMVLAYESAAEMLLARAGKLQRSAATLRRKRCYRIDDGDEIDVDRMLAGTPDFWRARTRGKKRPTVTIACQLVQSVSQDSESFARIAACAAAAVAVIEAAGVAVRVLGVWSGKEMGSMDPNDSQPKLRTQDIYCHTFPIKSAEEPFNASRMLAQCQSGVLRSLMFAYCIALVSPSSGLGRPWTPPAGHPLRKLIGVDHWIGKAPRDGQQMETLEAILRSTIPQLL